LPETPAGSESTAWSEKERRGTWEARRDLSSKRSTPIERDSILRKVEATAGVGLADSTRRLGEQTTWGSGGARPHLRRGTSSALRGRDRMSTELSKIAEKAKTDKKLRFTSLAHLLTPEFLKET
jgi:hypothetical protein